MIHLSLFICFLLFCAIYKKTHLLVIVRSCRVILLLHSGGQAAGSPQHDGRGRCMGNKGWTAGSPCRLGRSSWLRSGRPAQHDRRRDRRLAGWRWAKGPGARPANRLCGRFCLCLCSREVSVQA